MAKASFFCFHETGKMLQYFLKQTTTPEKQLLFSNSCSMIFLSETQYLFFGNNLLPHYQHVRTQGVPRQQGHSPREQRCVEQASVKENSCSWRLGHVFKPFSESLGFTTSRKHFSFTFCFSVAVIKGTSKPNISYLSGITNLSAHLRRQRKGWSQSTEDLFLSTIRLSLLVRDTESRKFNCCQTVMLSHTSEVVLLGCPSKARC